jgi:hypothetical protein
LHSTSKTSAVEWEVWAWLNWLLAPQPTAILTVFTFHATMSASRTETGYFLRRSAPCVALYIQLVLLLRQLIPSPCFNSGTDSDYRSRSSLSLNMQQLLTPKKLQLLTNFICWQSMWYRRRRDKIIFLSWKIPCKCKDKQVWPQYWPEAEATSDWTIPSNPLYCRSPLLHSIRPSGACNFFLQTLWIRITCTFLMLLQTPKGALAQVGNYWYPVHLIINLLVPQTGTLSDTARSSDSHTLLKAF